MNKLRSNQIFAVLLGSAAFPLLCRTEPFTIEGIFGAAIATAVQLLLCIPILLLYRTGFCFGECARRHRILPLCFIVYLLFRGGTSFVQLQQTSQEISLPFSEKFLAAALIALVCLYTVSLGIHTIARSSTMILGILLITPQTNCHCCFCCWTFPRRKPTAALCRYGWESSCWAAIFPCWAWQCWAAAWQKPATRFSPLFPFPSP